ncbi:MAG: hypothetical protein II007_03035 [Gammaproteobacteria bacterium]|nr:hypothetical protein [Gammaproteobacteria bacterium]
MNDSAWTALKATFAAKGMELPARFGERLRLWQLLEQESSCGGHDIDTAIDNAWQRFCGGERKEPATVSGGCASCNDASSCDMAGGTPQASY